ncbi:MAG: alpha-ketoglutarate-dependent dioxygenase AlkB [Sandaracinaceae bacterium]|nr:alpha-ketoglutarate-dependent dioxygenase AlkB [Sandaracinaceae bacterium]
MREDLGDGGWIELVEGFVPHHEAVMQALLRELPLRSDTIRIAGREVHMPRLTSWHGDPGAAYRYSGRTFEPEPWTPALAALRDALQAQCNLRFNSVLANLYRDGRDSMGAHADDEPELGPSRDDIRIASISLGARRRFVLAHRKKKLRYAHDLGQGSLLVMGGTLQRSFRHHVPKTALPVGPRLNLTFRVILAR